MNLRVLPSCAAIVVLGSILAGCGADVPVDEGTGGSNALADQARVAEVLAGSTLAGYGSHDTLQVLITNDRLSVAGGGGTVPVVAGLKLTETATVGTFAGSRTVAGGGVETYTVVLDVAGLVASLNVQKTGTGAGIFNASAGPAPTITGAVDGGWLLGATAALTTETGSGATRMTIDGTGCLWWDLDGDDGTTDDVVMIVLKADLGNLVGSATVLYDYDGNSTDDLVVLSVQVTISGGVVTRIWANADPVLDAPGPAQDWVDDATPGTSSPQALFGPWSALMAGHWLAIPTSGTVILTGAVQAVRQETERTSAGAFISTILNSSGAETETATITYAVDEKAGYPVVRMTVRTVVDRIGSPTDEKTRYAVYYARGNDGAVYRIGEWEDADDDAVIDGSEETLYAGAPKLTFPASQPADGAAYAVPVVRWGTSTANTHLRNLTFNGVAGHAAVSGALSAATTTVAPAGFTSVVGTGTSARLTAYWMPGSGIAGLRWAGDSLVSRRFVRADGSYQLIERQLSSTYADLVAP
jgi:hypothetical protein